MYPVTFLRLPAPNMFWKVYTIDENPTYGFLPFRGPEANEERWENESALLQASCMNASSYPTGFSINITVEFPSPTSLNKGDPIISLNRFFITKPRLIFFMADATLCNLL